MADTMTLEDVRDLLASYGNAFMDAVHAVDAAIRDRDRLRGDVSGMTEELLHVPSREEWRTLQKRADRAEAAIKQRERDAKDGEDSKDGARYRHMIETSPFMCFGASEYRCKADLDEAIDAAMAKESGNG